MSNRYCIKLECEPDGTNCASETSVPSPRFYRSDVWRRHESNPFKLTSSAERATAFTRESAEYTIDWVLRREAAHGQRLVMCDVELERATERERTGRTTERVTHRVLVFSGTHGAFGWNILYAEDLADLVADAAESGVTRAARYCWDKMEDGGGLASAFKPLAEMTQADWEWLIAPSPGEYRLLFPDS